MSTDPNVVPDPRDAEIERLRQENQNVRSAFNKRDAEVAALRKLAAERINPPATQTYSEPEDDDEPSGGRYDAEFLEQVRYETAETRFLVKNPAALSMWSKVEDTLRRMQTDPALADQYVAYDRKGRVNFNKVFSDVYRDLQLAEVRATTPSTTPPATTTTNSLRVAPVISGGGSSEPTVPPDPADMTLEQLREFVTNDPNDPIGGSGGSLR